VAYGQAPMTAFKVEPMSAGLLATRIPAPSSAAILSSALPEPPEMIAPAWPIRLPGGAVWPAMNAANGLVNLPDAFSSAACSSALPPISPIIKTASVSGSASNRFRTSTKLVPLTGSPPMPTQVLWPIPRALSCQTPS